MAISDFISVVQAAQQELVAANQIIAALENERREVAARPPHIDDIANALRRGLDAAQASYAKRLGFYLNDRNATTPHAAEKVAGSSAQLLNVPVMLPSAQWTTLFPDGDLGHGSSPLDVAAVTYFLRDRIEAEIPRLVEQFCPASRDGMRHEDRQKRLAEIDDQLSALRADRNRMLEELDTARQAVTPSGQPNQNQADLDRTERLLRERQLERSALRAELSDARMADPHSARTQNLLRDFDLLSEEVTRLSDKRSIIAAEVEAHRRFAEQTATR